MLQRYATAPCVDLSGLDFIVGLGVCGQDYWKNTPFRVDLEAFERALVEAVDHSGTRVLHHQFVPVPDVHSPTGWS